MLHPFLVLVELMSSQYSLQKYSQLYHPGIPDESIYVRNIVNSSVQRAQENGVTCVKVDFFYHVKVITSGEDQSSCINMKCNPVWNTTQAMQPKQRQMQKQWFDWVEVD